MGRGSGTVTSRPAAAIWPVDRASYRSSWFTTPPLTNGGTVGTFDTRQHLPRVHGLILVPARVDENGCAFHFREELLVADLLCFRRESATNGQKIRLLRQFLERH